MAISIAKPEETPTGTITTSTQTQGMSFLAREKARQDALAAARRAAAETELGIEATIGATEAGRDVLRQQAAAALAASQGLDVPAGGARAALGRGTAMEEGIKGAALEAEGAQREVEARQAAALAQLEAAKFAREIGSLSEDRQRKMMEYKSTINSIEDKHRGIFRFDRRAAAKEVMDLAAFEDDPRIKQFLINEAKRIGGESPISFL